jgi:hypothetical protein
VEAVMAHEDRNKMLKNTDTKFEKSTDEHKSAVELLADANHQIEELKLQIAWLERSYE